MHLSTVWAVAGFAQLLQLAAPVSGAVPSIPGYSLVWGDDFSGAAGHLPNEGTWLIRTGHGTNGWGNSEVQSYTRSPVNLRTTGGGGLWITPVRGRTGQWTSGRIESHRGDFMAPAGRKMIIQARISMPDVTGGNGLGYWPAFWTLGSGFRSGGVWPKIGEFDIMENVNGINQVWQGTHCDVNPGGVCNEPTGLVSPLGCGGLGCQGQFHTYSILVDRSVQPEAMHYSVDGVVHRTVTANQVGQSVWDQVVHHGHFVILSCAVGGAFPDYMAGNRQTPTSSTVSGKHMRVDNVGVYYSE